MNTLAIQTIVEKFWDRVSLHPERVALKRKVDGQWRDITWLEYGTEVARAGRGLMSLGMVAGDKMSLLSYNRPEWHYADLACMSAGGTTAPIYITNSAEQVAYIVAHSDSKIALVENDGQLAKILKCRSELSQLEKVVVLDLADRQGAGDFVMTWDELLEAGDGFDGAAFEAAREAVTATDIGTFVYTSGTTGPPKAVMLTHANVWWTCMHTVSRLPLGDLREVATDARTLSYLPLSHIAERMISHFLHIFYGTETWFAESLRTVPEDLAACAPTYFFGVPRVWEKLYARIEEALDEHPTARKDKIELALAKRAISVGRQVTEAEQEAVGRGGKLSDARLSPWLRAKHATLEALVLRKLRKRIGLGSCGLALSAAAPLNPSITSFFHALGIKITEGYGQSEDTGPTTWNPPDAMKIGTVGPPLEGVEVKIAPDGEILVRGGNVTSGYYKNDDATHELLDESGFMRSGDIGVLDRFDYLTITDRKKDLIITAGGKNIAPQELENRIKLHPLISQVVVIGDARPFLTALITLEPDKVPAWAEQHGIEDDASVVAAHAATLNELEVAINGVNATFAHVEGVRKFRVLERDFLEEENEITPTLKVKRKQINSKYADAIDDMYHEGSPVAGAIPAPVRT
ncbi:MAG: long-chain acyl-CoA synthetase [Actinomycetota bacterium]|nr:long-chain acyl-CoA synthetase [Actinomycetota bacterium]